MNTVRYSKALLPWFVLVMVAIACKLPQQYITEDFTEKLSEETFGELEQDPQPEANTIPAQEEPEESVDSPAATEPRGVALEDAVDDTPDCQVVGKNDDKADIEVVSYDLGGGLLWVQAKMRQPLTDDYKFAIFFLIQNGEDTDSAGSLIAHGWEREGANIATAAQDSYTGSTVEGVPAITADVAAGTFELEIPIEQVEGPVYLSASTYHTETAGGCQNSDSLEQVNITE